jgi:hypothetical protein
MNKTHSLAPKRCIGYLQHIPPTREKTILRTTNLGVAQKPPLSKFTVGKLTPLNLKCPESYAPGIQKNNLGKTKVVFEENYGRGVKQYRKILVLPFANAKAGYSL